MPRGSVSGGKPCLLELAFHGTHGRKLVGYFLDQFSEIPLFVASMGLSTEGIGYYSLGSLGRGVVDPDVMMSGGQVRGESEDKQSVSESRGLTRLVCHNGKAERPSRPVSGLLSNSYVSSPSSATVQIIDLIRMCQSHPGSCRNPDPSYSLLRILSTTHPPHSPSLYQISPSHGIITSSSQH
jgi:hypothetical protein